MADRRKKISVVIPAGNAAGTLAACLDALSRSDYADFEVIVVDDASTDGTAEIARRAGARVIEMDKRSGPAAARNRGAAAAAGDILLFIDADVLVAPDTLSRAEGNLSGASGASAVVGMLSLDIPFRNPASLYFNLRKHFDYLLIKDDLKNLYTSVSAVRREVFERGGGFDERYKAPSVEDAELGRRLWRMGERIVLDKTMQVVHLKHLTLASLLVSDCRRSASFMKLLLRERLAGRMVKERRFVSFRAGSIASIVLTPALLASAFPPVIGASRLPFILILFLFLAANERFFRFAVRETGLLKSIAIPFILLLDSLSVGCGLMAGLAGYLCGRRF